VGAAFGHPGPLGWRAVVRAMDAIVNKLPVTAGVEDVQGRADTRRIPINRVGIKDITHPVRVKDRASGEQHTIATFNMYVNLPHDFKGTHMSRFVSILNQHEREISVESFQSMLEEMTVRLEANAGHIEMTFPFFITKRAPVSGVASVMDYRASLLGERRDGKTCARARATSPSTALTTSVRM
jgi:GTP cyclohydrolase I